MSRVYDNWATLVAAVVKREQIWELFHASSRRTSISSILSDFDSFSSSRFDEDLKYAESEVQESGYRIQDERIEIYEPIVSKDADKFVSPGRNELLSLLETTFDESMGSSNSDGQIVNEWVDNYEPGVFVTIRALKDGSNIVISVGFSLRGFKVHMAKAWWRVNQEDVYEKYNAQDNLAQNRQLSDEVTANISVIEWIEEVKGNRVRHRQEGGRLSMEYNGIPRLVMVKDTILETNFNEILTSANLDGPGNSVQEKWVETIQRYEPGVYVSLEDSKDRIRVVARVRFSRNIFRQHEAVTWWVKNREKVYRRYRINNEEMVYKKYNDRFGLRKLSQIESASKAPSLDEHEKPVVSKDADKSVSPPSVDKRENTIASKDADKFVSPGRNELLSLLETTFDESMGSSNSDGQIVTEWVDNYEPGVFVTIRSLKDGSRGVISIGFSLRRFKVHTAKAWWRNNQEIVYKNYNAQRNLAQNRQSSDEVAVNISMIEWIEEYATITKGNRVRLRYYSTKGDYLGRQEGGRLSMEYNGIPRLVMVKDTILETHFNEILTSANLDGPGNSGQLTRGETIQRYEPGVYVSLEDYEDMTSNVARVRFSRNMFKQYEAVAWWVKNREKVYQRYKIP